MAADECSALALGILRYGKRVAKLGQYVSLFDLALMAYAEKVQIVLHVEERAVKIIDEYLPELRGCDTRGTMHVIWCMWGADLGRWVTVHGQYHSASHFMLLVPIMEHLHTAPGGDVVPTPIPVETWAASRGYLVRDVAAEGNCGIDCLAAFLGMQRSPRSWLSIRMKLADLCTRLCTTPMWQRAFLESGETPASLSEGPPATAWEQRRILLASKGLASKSTDRVAVWLRGKKAPPPPPVPAATSTVPAPTSAAAFLPAGDVVSEPAGDVVPAPAGELVSAADLELASAVAWACGCSQKALSPRYILQSVQTWAGLMDAEQRLAIVEAFRLSQTLLSKHTNAAKPPLLHRKRSYRQTLLSFRESIGRACEEWLATPEGRECRLRHKHWVRAAQMLGLSFLTGPKGRKAVAQFTQRCHEGYMRSPRRHSGRCREVEGLRPAPHWAFVPHKLRRRARGAQGNPGKTADLSTALYQWFVDHRSLIKGRATKRLVASQARTIALAISMENCSGGVVPAPPVINSKWLSRWRHQWGVSLRRPTTRYKVNRQVLKARLKLFWSNILAVRFFFTKAFGIDPIQEQYDQKGVHFNEPGSKNAPTYELSHTPDVVLREDHAQTRARTSWMTGCISDVVRAGRPIPLEQLFKAKTGARILRNLVVPDAQRYTLQTSPSGSYRVEHVITFLERHLLPWSEERRRLSDYRILSLDAYKCHMDPAIAALAWSRGYVYASGVMVPGGATGVVQGPDTDLHAWVEAELVALQDLEATAKLMERPHKTPSNSRQDMINYATCIWESADHANAAASFKRNGLTNSLSGEEDILITRAARAFWLEIGMSAVRDVVREEVEAYMAGLAEPLPEHVFELIKSYDTIICGIGTFEEGQEVEPPLKDGERPDADREESVTDSEDSASDCDPGGDVAAVGGDVGAVETLESAPLGVLSDLRTMETLIHVAKSMDDKSTLALLEVRREKLLRQIRRGDADNATAAARFLAAQKEEAMRARAEASRADAEAQLLKRHKKDKKDARIALTLKTKEKVPLPLPAPPLELCDDERRGGAEEAGVAAPPVDGVVAPSKTDVVVLPKPATGVERLPPGSPVFAVEVDNAARVAQVLARLAADWVHDHKKPTLRWVANELTRECIKYRRGELVLKCSKFFSGTSSLPDSKAKGHMELFVINRIQKLSVPQRAEFFNRQFRAMCKRDKVSSGLGDKRVCFTFMIVWA